jgi:hypothetical protein
MSRTAVSCYAQCINKSQRRGTARDEIHGFRHAPITGNEFGLVFYEAQGVQLVEAMGGGDAANGAGKSADNK